MSPSDAATFCCIVRVATHCYYTAYAVSASIVVSHLEIAQTEVNRSLELLLVKWRELLGGLCRLQVAANYRTKKPPVYVYEDSAFGGVKHVTCIANCHMTVVLHNPKPFDGSSRTKHRPRAGHISLKHCTHCHSLTCAAAVSPPVTRRHRSAITTTQVTGQAQSFPWLPQHIKCIV